MTTLLFACRYGEEFEKQQQQSREYLKTVPKDWEVVVLEGRVEDPGDYARELNRLWSCDGDLMVLEGDIVPGPGQMEEMVRCTECWCAVDYVLHLCDLEVVHMGDKAVASICMEHEMPLHSYRTKDEFATKGYSFPEAQLEHADLVGLGCTKMGPAMRERIPPPRDEIPWNILDDWIARKANFFGLTAHIHYPQAQHNHPRHPDNPHIPIRVDGVYCPCYSLAAMAGPGAAKPVVVRRRPGEPIRVVPT